VNIDLAPEERRLKEDVIYLAGGDLNLALDLLVRCHAASCDRISAGYTRAGSLASPRRSPKARTDAIDIPAAGSPEASSPV
jgi:hypothetical protein